MPAPILREDPSWQPIAPNPMKLMLKTSSTFVTETSRCWRVCSSRAARVRSRPTRRRLVPRRPPDGQTDPRAVGEKRRGRGVAGFSRPTRRLLPRFVCRHKLRSAMAQGAWSEFHARPDTVGIMGSSSGGHQAMLAAMRPNDPRYSESRLPAGSPAVDASVSYVVVYWPVIDPLARYHYARRLKAGGKPYPELVDLVLPLH